MIRIKFDEIANVQNNYWNLLNPKTTQKKYYKKSLINTFESHILKHISTPIGNFMSEFCKNNYELLEEVVKCRTDDVNTLVDLVAKVDKLRILHGVEEFYLTKDGKGEMTASGEALYFAFCFEEDFQAIINAKKYLFESTQSITCPYCNMVEIKQTATDTNKIYNNYDLDHYYPKWKYPYLAISLYNLIPSCIECNRTYKRGKEFDSATHLNPHRDNFDDECKFYPIFGEDLTVILNDINNLVSTYSRDKKKAIDYFETNISKKIDLCLMSRSDNFLNNRTLNYSEDFQLYSRYKHAKYKLIEPVYCYFKNNISQKTGSVFKKILANWGENIEDELSFLFLTEGIGLNKNRIAVDPYAKLEIDLYRYFIELKYSS